jgi:hypothetical protein
MEAAYLIEIKSLAKPKDPAALDRVVHIIPVAISRG